MKKHLYLSIFLTWAVSGLTAQSIPGFSLTQEVECNGQTLTQPEFWRAYQTLNNEWDGAVDSTSCVKWMNNGLDLTDADTSRPVFVRLVDTAPILLESDFLYGLDLCMDWDADNWGIDLEDESYCNNGFCHGTMVRVGIPPAPQDTVDVAYRTHTAAFQWANVFGEIIELCFATEYFEEQYLEELVFKFIPDGTAINFYCVLLHDDWDEVSMIVDQEDVASYQTGPTDYYFLEWGVPSSFLFRYQEDAYPSDTTISYIEFTPDPNTETTQMVTVQFSESCTYTLQPFTQLRAGNLLGSDTEYHNLQLINKAHELCLIPYVELVFDPDDRLVHAGGPIDLQGNTSCFRFHTGSTLEVAAGHELKYGMRGDGMLALYGGAEIMLQEDARLVLNNHVKLFSHPWQQPVRPVEVHLKKSSELVFGPKSKLSNASTDEAVKLKVYMEGGTIDLSGLKPEDRRHVALIFPTATARLEVRGNPFTDKLNLWWPDLLDGPVNVQIHTPQGTLMHDVILENLSGMPLSLEVSEFIPGTYVVEVEQGDLKAGVQVVKQ